MFDLLTSSSSQEEENSYAKYCFLPITSKRLHEFYCKQRDSVWTAQELDFSNDQDDWLSLDPKIRDFLKFILAFFAQADGVVIENLMQNFQRETDHIKEARNFYAVQTYIETIHNETYGMMIVTYITDVVERDKALDAIKNYPSVHKIGKWMFEWMDRTKSTLLERVIAFASVEGILFSGAFCAIYWIKIHYNKLPGMCKANEWIARDEGLHTQFAVALYKHFTEDTKEYERLSESRVHEIIKSATDLAENFVRTSLKVETIEMSQDQMIEYIQCTSDVLCGWLGYSPIYNAKNPFPWMNLIGMDNKSNFFEHVVTEYSKGHNSNAFEFTTDEDF